MSTLDRLRVTPAGNRLTIPGVIGIAATVYLFADIGGAIGLTAGGGLIIVTALFPPVVAFGLGQALVLVVIPRPTLLQLLLVQLALFLVLVDAATRWRAVAVPVQLEYMVARARSAAPGSYIPVAISALGTFVVLGAATLVVAARLGIRDAAGGLVVGVAAVGYVLHRYERVRLGLAGEGEAVVGASGDTTDGAAGGRDGRADARPHADGTDALTNGDGGARS